MSEKTYQLDEIAAMLKPLMEKYKVDEMYLFGSYARGEVTVISIFSSMAVISSMAQ